MGLEDAQQMPPAQTWSSPHPWLSGSDTVTATSASGDGDGAGVGDGEGSESERLVFSRVVELAGFSSSDWGIGKVGQLDGGHSLLPLLNLPSLKHTAGDKKVKQH